MAVEFDPYHRWLSIPPGMRPPSHYQLLGLAAFEDDLEVIADAADRQMAHVRRYSLGPQGALSQRILDELAAARACLLSPARRAQYDQALRLAGAGPLRSPPPPPGADEPAAGVSEEAIPRSLWIALTAMAALTLVALVSLAVVAGRRSGPSAQAPAPGSVNDDPRDVDQAAALLEEERDFDGGWDANESLAPTAPEEGNTAITAEHRAGLAGDHPAAVEPGRHVDQAKHAGVAGALGDAIVAGLTSWTPAMAPRPQTSAEGAAPAASAVATAPAHLPVDRDPRRKKEDFVLLTLSPEQAGALQEIQLLPLQPGISTATIRQDGPREISVHPIDQPHRRLARFVVQGSEVQASLYASVDYAGFTAQRSLRQAKLRLVFNDGQEMLLLLGPTNPPPAGADLERVFSAVSGGEIGPGIEKFFQRLGGQLPPAPAAP